MDKPFYEIDGRKYPRVTSIIGQALGNNYAHVPEDVMATAAQYGTAMHKAVELYLSDNLVESDLDIGLHKGFEAFKNAWSGFLLTRPGAIFSLEETIHSKKYGFAGTCDIAYFSAGGKLILIDIKTRKPNIKYDALQLAAYSICFEELHGLEVESCLVLSIDHKGKAEFKDVNIAGARQTFLAALQIYNWRE